MTSPWRKLENENGFPFYVKFVFKTNINFSFQSNLISLLFFSEITNLKQWDHPEYTNIFRKLEECSYIKYSSYRLAMKIRYLQNLLHSK